jgi:uncharacterized membrane protein YoaK (UPF0700 family)
MYRLEREQFLSGARITLWSAFGFQAGFINAYGFLLFGWFVSHVTGLGTQIGMAMGRYSFQYEVEMVGVPISFVVGAFVSGCFTSARLERGLSPLYDYVLFVIPVILAMLCIGGAAGWFGDFHAQELVWYDFLYLYLLSFCCGLQNACIAVLTRGQIRTTHLTGIATDLGTDLARVLFGGLKDRELLLTRKTNFTRISTFVFFTVGSMISVGLTHRFRYQALAVPLFTSVILALVMTLVRRNLDKVWKTSPVESK